MPQRVVERYVKEEFSIGLIAYKERVSYEEVLGILKSNKTKLRNPKKASDTDADWLHYQYWELSRNAAEMALELGMTTTTIVNRMKAFGIPRRSKGAYGERASASKLTPDLVKMIRAAEDKSCGFLQKELAAMGVAVSRQAIWKVVNNQSWVGVV